MNARYSPLERTVFTLALLLAEVIFFHVGKGFMHRQSPGGGISQRTQVPPSSDLFGETGSADSGVVGELPAMNMPEPGRQRTSVPDPVVPSRRQP